MMILIQFAFRMGNSKRCTDLKGMNGFSFLWRAPKMAPSWSNTGSKSIAANKVGKLSLPCLKCREINQPKFTERKSLIARFNTSWRNSGSTWDAQPRWPESRRSAKLTEPEGLSRATFFPSRFASELTDLRAKRKLPLPRAHAHPLGESPFRRSGK